MFQGRNKMHKATALTALSLLFCSIAPAYQEAKPKPKVEQKKVVTAKSVVGKPEYLEPVPAMVRQVILTSPKASKDAIRSDWTIEPFGKVLKIEKEEPNRLVLLLPASPEIEYNYTWVLKEPGQPQQVIRGKFKAGKGPRPPPDPDQPVDPDEPVDPEKPAPIEGVGLRVLVIYKDADYNQYTADQRAIITSLSFRQYLDKNCAKDAKAQNNTAYRIWHEELNVAGDGPEWVKAYARPRNLTSGGPWLIVSNGKTGFEGQAPKTMKEIKDLMSKYGFKD
jgi:hypothetical protein